MDRCRDYCGFVIWFAGLGYAVLWPLTAVGHSGHPFGAAWICGRTGGGAIAALCRLPHPFMLPVGLHVLGLVAAFLLAARLVRDGLRRWRARPCIIPAASVAVRLPGAIPARPRMPVPRVRAVKSRRQFGLRGLPR